MKLNQYKGLEVVKTVQIVTVPFLQKIVKHRALYNT